MTKPDDTESVKKAERSKKRDDRRKSRSLKQANCTMDSNTSSYCPVASEDNTGNILHEMSSTFSDCEQTEITFPVNGSYQTEELLCLNCKKNPFVYSNETKFEDNSCQTEQDIFGELEIYKHDNASLSREVKFYKHTALNNFNVPCEESLSKNDELVNFYTGLFKFSLLKFFFDFCNDFVPYNQGKSALSKFSEFLLVMMKLRLNVPYKDLAFRFKIDETTASRLFVKWIDGMYEASKKFIMWPNRADRAVSMPIIFKQSYGDRIASIIDCFEVFIIRPSNLKARAQTWSHYKSHNTIKYLISITPQGTVNFISKSWGGRVSDKQITTESGFLNKLVPGDMVMADRGFCIEDLLAPINCSLAIPSFTKGKTQLSYEECKKSREIANLRIHVERVIGLIRNKFPILAGIISIDLLTVKEGDELPLIDKIATICCALVNISPSIVNDTPSDESAD
jgi:DDE superfamily endonuclease/Helix-turn-helix of DDE superfamily endonuclease